MKKNIKKSGGNIILISGFTLVEMIIYAAILSIISIATTAGVITMMRSFAMVRITQNINQSATVAMDRMAYEIRNAYNVDEANSTFGTSPGRLTLITKDSLGNNTTVEFYVSSNHINMKVGGVEQGALTVTSSEITNLVFYLITTNHSKAIKIETTLYDTRQGVERTVNFYDTIVLRGSIQ